MKVKLIQMTRDPIDVMWVAARTCYSSKSPNEMWEDCENDKFNVLTTEKHWKLVKAVLDSGHQSIAEHVTFTFTIEGISRACSHQLVRHRAGIVFSQQSQRYVEIKESYEEVRDLVLQIDPMSSYYCQDRNKLDELESKLLNILQKYFIIREDSLISLGHALMYYLQKTDKGIKAEDARANLPNATKTSITMTVNFRELIHLCNLRLCTRAQFEIRKLFKEVVNCVKLENEYLASYLVPQCEVLGLCTEKNCCGKKPTLNEVMDVYNKHKEFEKHINGLLKNQQEKELMEKCGLLDDTLSKRDYNTMMESINNPKVNEKLRELMKMKSTI